MKKGKKIKLVKCYFFKIRFFGVFIYSKKVRFKKKNNKIKVKEDLKEVVSIMNVKMN